MFHGQEGFLAEDPSAKLKLLKRQLAEATTDEARSQFLRQIEREEQNLARLSDGRTANVDGAQPSPEGAATSAVEGGTGGRFSRIAEQIKQRTQELREKFKAEAIKKAALAAGQAVWAAIVGVLGPAALPVALIVAGVFLIIFIAIGVYFATRSGPRPEGMSYFQNVNPVSDKEWLQKIMLDANDPDVKKNFESTFAERFATAIDEALATVQKIDPGVWSGRDAMIRELGEIKSKINSFQRATSDQDKLRLSNEIITAIKNLAKKYASVSIAYNPDMGEVSLPFKAADVSKISYGKGLHFNTRWLPVDAPGHRTFMFYKLNAGDAADFSIADGTEVLAMMDGTIENGNSECKGSAGCTAYRLVKKTTDHVYKVIYGHIELSGTDTTGKPVQIGSTVKAGQVIGKIRTGHLHSEVAIDGAPLIYQQEDIFGAECGGLEEYDLTVAKTTVKSKKCKNPYEIARFYWKYLTVIFQKPGGNN